MPGAASTSPRWAVSAAALAAAAAHWLLPTLLVLPQDPAGPGLGPFVTDPAFRAIGVVSAAGAALSLRFRSAGVIVLGTALIASGFIVLWEFRPPVLLLPLTLAIPTALLAAPPTSEAQPSTNSRRTALATIVAGSIVIWRALRTHGDGYGPTHPASTNTAPNWLAEWLWVGGVQVTSATVTAGGLAPSSPHRLALWTDIRVPDESTDIAVIDVDTDPDGIARFLLTNLDAETEYWYRVMSNTLEEAASTNPELVPDSTFRTQPDRRHDVTIAFGSCARTGSNGAVFDAIRAVDPDLFVSLGDLHYGNLASTNSADHLHVLGRSLSTPAQSALFSSVASAWVWDDHDFGDNDSDATSPSRHAVSVAYRQAVPHWNVDPDPAAPINQAFSIGGVRVIITDTRSQRTADTMLGREQETWLVNELNTSSETHDVLVWANPAPWNVPARPGSDQWGGFPEERRRIANAIAAANITNLVMISGDWHFSAIDDGTNTAFADDGTAGFPLIHAAPLDRPGARTSDAYSHGVFSNAGQFGALRVAYDGDSVSVTLTSYLWTGAVLGELTLNMD